MAITRKKKKKWKQIREKNKKARERKKEKRSVNGRGVLEFRKSEKTHSQHRSFHLACAG